MEIRPTILPGCFEIEPPCFNDDRGSFVKTFQHDLFLKQDLVTDWQEEYYTVSNAGVLRGLHFQIPPCDHEKMVHCTRGKALDVVVDLRRGSPTFGQHVVFELAAVSPCLIYIPRGMAHGFLALEDETTMAYSVASAHAPSFDKGILWSSCGIPWPSSASIISRRDQSLPPLADFESPFVFTP